MKAKVMLITAFMLVVSLVMIAQEPPKDNIRKISVTGTATLELPPDNVMVRISVNTIDKSPQAAFAANTEKGKKTLAELEAFGILQKDIATNYTTLTKEEAERENSTPVFLGYEAFNSITIILRDISKYDAMMSGILKSGVSEIESVTFRIEDESEKMKEARIQAIRSAKEKADYMAGVLGQKVCVPLKISEKESGYSPNSNFYYEEAPIFSSSSLIPNNIKISSSVMTSCYVTS